MVDENLPKQDITKSIEELMQKMNDEKWALRKKALDDAGNLLKSSGYLIKVKNLTDFITTVKARLVDSIQQVGFSGLGFMEHLVKALKEDYKQFNRQLTPHVAKFLLQKSPEVQELCYKVLDHIKKYIGYDSTLTALFMNVEQPNSEIKQRILEYTLEDPKLAVLLKNLDIKKYGLFLLQGYVDKNKLMRKVCSEVIFQAWT